ncbi:MAG: 2-dehydropantoate 2-reductase [Solirubrobacteraceae bacterium]
MRIAVLGAGAIGAYVGASLHRGGADVTLIARGAHLAAMRANGVQVHSPRGDFHASVPATQDPAEVGPVDHVILGLKAQDYASAAPLLAPLLGPETSVVAAQNGIPWWYFFGETGPYEGRRIEAVDPGGAVSAVLEPRRAIGCVVYSSTELQAPGVVRHLEGTRFSIGEPDGSRSERCRELSEAMVAGGLKCPVEPDIRNDMWIKLLGNVAFNPLSALTRATMVQIATDPLVRALITTVMEETLEVARRLGRDLEMSIERRIEGARRVGAHRTSMLQDLEAGKRLELAPVIGAVVELAELVGAEIPATFALYAAASLLDQVAAAGGAARSGRGP